MVSGHVGVNRSPMDLAFLSCELGFYHRGHLGVVRTVRNDVRKAPSSVGPQVSGISLLVVAAVVMLLTDTAPVAESQARS